MKVVDASVLIAQLDEHDALHTEAVTLLLDTAEQPLAASPLTIAEVLVGPARQDRLEAAVDALGLLELQEIPFAADAAVRLAVLHATTNLKLSAAACFSPHTTVVPRRSSRSMTVSAERPSSWASALP